MHVAMPTAATCVAFCVNKQTSTLATEYYTLPVTQWNPTSKYFYDINNNAADKLTTTRQCLPDSNTLAESEFERIEPQ